MISSHVRNVQLIYKKAVSDCLRKSVVLKSGNYNITGVKATNKHSLTQQEIRLSQQKGNRFSEDMNYHVTTKVGSSVNLRENDPVVLKRGDFKHAFRKRKAVFSSLESVLS